MRAVASGMTCSFPVPLTFKKLGVRMTKVENLGTKTEYVGSEADVP